MIGIQGGKGLGWSEMTKILKKLEFHLAHSHNQLPMGTKHFVQIWAHLVHKKSCESSKTVYVVTLVSKLERASSAGRSIAYNSALRYISKKNQYILVMLTL